MDNLDQILAENNIIIDNSITDTLLITMRGVDQHFPLTQLNLTMESSDEEILSAISGIISEMNPSVNNIDQLEFKIMKTTNSNNIYVVPDFRWA